MTAAFLAAIMLSLLLALMSQRIVKRSGAREFFVASGRFGSLLFFFLGVGETYSVGTFLGFPSGLSAGSVPFLTWFVGYILLAFAVGFFLYPCLWRAGRMADAVTLPDLFREHFKSRFLELVVTVSSLVFLLPLGVMQFTGLRTVLLAAGWPVSTDALLFASAGLAFCYVAISGVRASAWVAILKDVLVLGAVVLTGLAAVRAFGHEPVARGSGAIGFAGGRIPSWHTDLFVMSTILAQAVGFCITPQTCAYVFTARSPAAIRRAQIVMPLYMVLFPLLMLTTLYGLRTGVLSSSTNGIFLDTARLLLPDAAFGVVLAGASLSALVILAGVGLTVGSLLVRNVASNLPESRQAVWSRVAIAAYLILSVLGAIVGSPLMAALNNLFYFGIVQVLPGLALVMTGRRVSAPVVAAAIVLGDFLGVGMAVAGAAPGGLNPGLVGLAANGGIVLAALFSASRYRKSI